MTRSPVCERRIGSVSVTNFRLAHVDVQVVLVAEMLDPVDRAVGMAVRRLLDRQMLGARADRLGAGRRAGIGQQAGAAAG